MWRQNSRNLCERMMQKVGIQWNSMESMHHISHLYIDYVYKYAHFRLWHRIFVSVASSNRTQDHLGSTDLRSNRPLAFDVGSDFFQRVSLWSCKTWMPNHFCCHCRTRISAVLKLLLSHPRFAPKMCQIKIETKVVLSIVKGQPP